MTSGLCGLAWSAESLIAFRVLQGLAGGMIMPIGMITLAQAAGPQRMGRVMSVVGVPMLLARCSGRCSAALIVENLSWRWIFYVNLPVGHRRPAARRAAAAPGARAAGPRRRARAASAGLARARARSPPASPRSSSASSEYGTHRTFAASSAWLPLVLGLLAVVRSSSTPCATRYPIVDVSLFRVGRLLGRGGTTFLTGIALFGSMILLPLYYQIARGESPLIAGLLIAPQGLGAAIGMNLGGRATDRYGGGQGGHRGPAVPARRHGVFTQAGAAHVLLADRRRAGAARASGWAATMMPAMAAAYATLSATRSRARRRR